MKFPYTHNAWGVWCDEMKHKVKSIIYGRKVWDVGAGNGYDTYWMANNGAFEVVSVDAAPLDKKLFRDFPHVTLVHEYFHNLLPIPDTDIVLVSWPHAYSDGLVDLIQNAGMVIYLGKNFDGVRCGPDDFWAYVRYHRDILWSCSTDKNTMIIYGPHHEFKGDRPALLDEVTYLFERRCIPYGEFDIEKRQSVYEWAMEVQKKAPPFRTPQVSINTIKHTIKIDGSGPSYGFVSAKVDLNQCPNTPNNPFAEENNDE